jgi:dihydropteroate synthase
MHEKKIVWRSKNRLIEINSPCVMGIINCTPDSFFSGSRFQNVDQIVSRAQDMILAGASILDIGGASTRPGANQPDLQEEVNRVIPAIKAIRNAFPEALISVDSYRTMVAKEALDAGADIVNDISALKADLGMWDLVASRKVPYIVMHKEGTIQSMHQRHQYDDTVLDIIKQFSNVLLVLKSRGIFDVALDPGFGFSKSLDDNYHILKNLHIFRMLNKPLLVGVSRKSMIYKYLEINQDHALPATTVLHFEALRQGAEILRVHDVPEAMQAIRIFGKLFS